MGELTGTEAEKWRAGQRVALQVMSAWAGDWQGIPVPLPENPLTLAKGHPLASVYRSFDGAEYELMAGGPDLGDGYRHEEIVNHWFCHKYNATIYVWKASGPGLPDRYFHLKVRRSDPMERLTMWLTTMGASDAWDLDAEHRAREKLQGLLSERQWRFYDLTGAFIETSPRSNLMYVFRRLRPTIALTPRWPTAIRASRGDTMRCLATLCLHPVGYYSRSWAGCMVPTDDVIAHLLWMRADEAGFWGHANQHEAWQPEAGL